MFEARRVDNAVTSTPSEPTQRQSMGPSHSDSFEVTIDSNHSYGPLLPKFRSGEIERCYMLISPNTPYESRLRVEAVLKWLTERSLRTVVIDGGYLDRWNLEYVNGLSRAAAAAAALKKSERIERRVQRLVAVHGWSGRVEFWDYRRLLQDSRFKQTQAWLQELLLVVAFRESVDEHVDAYLSRRAGSFNRKEIYATRLRNYVLEEIALSMALHAHGLPAECYVGPDLGVVEQMTRGEFGSPPVDLADRTFVSLTVQRA